MGGQAARNDHGNPFNVHGSEAHSSSASVSEPGIHASSFHDSAGRCGGKDAKLTASSSPFYSSCELRLAVPGNFPEINIRPFRRAHGGRQWID